MSRAKNVYFCMPDDSGMFSKEDLKKKLPKVGDVMIRNPRTWTTLHKPKGRPPMEASTAIQGPGKPCEVVYVDEEKLTYTVKFTFKKGSFLETIKLPEIN